MGKILVSPLSWGLGHATRDMPIINHLLECGHDVGIAACGIAYELLEREYPCLKFYDVKDYPSPYTAKGFSVPRVVALFPLMYKAILREHKTINEIVSRDGYDLIISDNRFGAYSKKAPSIFISHQIRYSTPGSFEVVEYMTEVLNEFFHKNFERVIIPDNPPGELSLSGKLGHASRPETKRRAYYAGIIANIEKKTVLQDIDYLISISGPKKTKEALKNTLMSQIDDLSGEKVILLGDPGSDFEERPKKDILIKSHASRHEMEDFLNRAKCVITRSGYTTVMELAELGGKHALFIPTPGQTEQEYLSEYYSDKGWFHSVAQKDINLSRDIEITKKMAGLPPMTKSKINVKQLYENVIKKYLSNR